MKLKKKVAVIIIFVILGIVVAGGYLTIAYTSEDKKLEREIDSLTKLDITKDKFNEKYVTTGDYRKVEMAIKDYLQEYADNLQQINKILNGEEFTKLLTYESLSTDTNYRDSIIYINQIQSSINSYIDKLIILSNKDNIKSNINDYNLDSYYVNLYNELMIDGKLSKKFNLSEEYLEKYRQSINNKITTCNELFYFLNSNQRNLKYEDGELKLNSDNLMLQYTQYINKLRA